MITRRNAIAAALAAPAAVLRARSSPAAEQSLAAAAAAGNRFFGSAVRIDQIDANEPYRDAVVRECTYVVPEFEMNWNRVEPSYGALSFGTVDRLASFAARNGKKVRGHTLLWHLGTPQWAIAMLRQQRDWSLISRYFGSIIPRYGDVVDQWEVVNEPLDPGYRSDGLRRNVFLEVFGAGYIARALATARTFAPRAQLMINDFGLEYDLPDERNRRYLLLKLLERLRRAGAPLDALGVQAHLDLTKGRIDAAAVRGFLRDVANLGLAIVITELDVKESDYTATMAQRDRLVADEVRRYLEVVLAQNAVTGVTTWGLSDLYSWLDVTPQDLARFPGAWSAGNGPGLNRGLPFDSSMQPKPMYFAILDAFRTSRPRNQKR
ncbi:MAG TPA: endo-1,4-beta-xylanase [Candidatus Cybelea sp.]